MKKILCLALLLMACPSWAGSRTGWIGKGGDDVVQTGDKDSLTTSTENYTGGDLGSKDSLVIFKDSAPGSNDSIEIKYSHKMGQNAKGEWSWVSANIPTDGWDAFDLTGKELLQFYVKGLPKDGNFLLNLADKNKKMTDRIAISKYIKEAKDWTKVTIPLADFPGLDKLDLKNMASLDFDSDTEGDFDLFFDNIVFDKAPVKEKPKSKSSKKKKAKS